MQNRLRRGCPDFEIGYPAPCGTIVGGEPRVGVWLRSDNQSCGEIDDFVAEMTSCNDPVWPLSKRHIDSIPAEQRRFSEGKTARAKVHARLAARAEPRLMGAAIGAGDLDVSGALATRFAQWLEKLFGDQA